MLDLLVASLVQDGGLEQALDSGVLREFTSCTYLSFYVFIFSGGCAESVLSNRGFGIKSKKCLYEGVIVPTALHGAEA